MSKRTRLSNWLSVYADVGGAIAFTLVLVGIAAWLIVQLDGKEVAAWVPVVVGVAFLVAASVVSVVAYRLRRRPRVIQPATAAVAVQELEVATNYIKHVRDFMEGLRLSAIGLPPAEALPRLENLRELVFDAIIQGINRLPGEHIRCALLAPSTEDGTTVLRVRSHRGHTHRVEHLALHLNSVAGIAYTTRAPVYVANAGTDPRVETTTAGRPVSTLYCLPLYAFHGAAPDPVGVFSVASSTADAFSETDRAFISACADMIAVVEFFIDVWRNMQEQEAAQSRAENERRALAGARAQVEIAPEQPGGG